MPTTSEKFRLIRYIKADLIRQRQLNGDAGNSSLIWLGLFSPRFIPVFLCRVAHRLQLAGLSPLAKIISLINFFLFGIEIAVRCPIGPGLYFPHTHGTVIGAASIGANATIFQGVTLGALELDFSYEDSSRPKLGNGVIIGAGAKILGGVILEDSSRVGANAVVLHSVPARALAVGVPAKNIMSS